MSTTWNSGARGFNFTGCTVGLGGACIAGASSCKPAVTFTFVTVFDAALGMVLILDTGGEDGPERDNPGTWRASEGNSSWLLKSSLMPFSISAYTRSRTWAIANCSSKRNLSAFFSSSCLCSNIATFAINSAAFAFSFALLVVIEDLEDACERCDARVRLESAWDLTSKLSSMTSFADEIQRTVFSIKSLIWLLFSEYQSLATFSCSPSPSRSSNNAATDRVNSSTVARNAVRFLSTTSTFSSVVVEETISIICRWILLSTVWQSVHRKWAMYAFPFSVRCLRLVTPSARAASTDSRLSLSICSLRLPTPSNGSITFQRI